MKEFRLERINAEFKREIANLINKDLKDPRIKGVISVLSVETDNDLYMSNVYVSVYNADATEVLKGLESCAGYVRKQLAKLIKLRTIPIINFKLDTTMEYSSKINSILNSIEIPTDDNDSDSNDN